MKITASSKKSNAKKKFLKTHEEVLEDEEEMEVGIGFIEEAKGIRTFSELASNEPRNWPSSKRL